MSPHISIIQQYFSTNRETPMTTRPVILLDDGGVMNDNQLRGEQWPSLVGEFFAPRLGGTIPAWAEANRIIIQRILEPTSWLRRVQASADYASFEQRYWLDWLGDMAQFVGVPLPPENECILLAQQAEKYIIPRVRSAFPGASDAIQELYTEGYILHTASAESSIHLMLYLEGMGVRHCFERLYGSDLLNAFKDGPAYYARLFADLQIAPGDALIVDDSPHALAWARSLGAHTILVGTKGEADNRTLHINSLAELPAFLQRNWSVA
jgi:HAD superfamily hydrolase (TIGR01509 family)